MNMVAWWPLGHGHFPKKYTNASGAPEASPATLWRSVDPVVPLCGVCLTLSERLMVAAREPTARAGAVELANIPARGLAYRPRSGGPVLQTGRGGSYGAARAYGKRPVSPVTLWNGRG